MTKKRIFDSFFNFKYDIIKLVIKMKSLIPYLLKNKELTDKIKYYYQIKLITNFNKSLIENFKNIRYDHESSVYDYFEKGLNIGNCHLSSLLISPLFEDFTIERGKMEYIKDLYKTHSWLVSDDYVYDTTFLIKFPKALKEELGYQATEVITKEECLQEGTITKNILDFVEEKNSVK